MSERAILFVLLLIAIFSLSYDYLYPLISTTFLTRAKIEVIDRNFNVSEYPIAEVSTKGFIPANVSVDAILLDRAQISLKAGCYLIQATTDAYVGNAILKGLEGKVDFRPTVYDVILDAFRNLGINVLAVKIVEMRENTFIGQLIIQQKDKVLILDSRPSDATAIAIRTKAPIYINETLAKEVGKYIC
ncbi:MAG: bifunctional nuclease family protein [Candidatus Aenigmarchaeota archaeon]|jgi:bifunctional DNase/RNase|nr:bifunctional nuclease family protein [Candidatus Aenigmarchaeota archaeon]